MNSATRGVMRGVQSCLTFGLGMTLGAVYDDPERALARIDEWAEKHGPEPTLKALLDTPETFGTLKSEAVCPALPFMPSSAVRQMVVQFQMFRMVYVSVLSGR